MLYTRRGAYSASNVWPFLIMRRSLQISSTVCSPILAARPEILPRPLHGHGHVNRSLCVAPLHNEPSTYTGALRWRPISWSTELTVAYGASPSLLPFSAQNGQLRCLSMSLLHFGSMCILLCVMSHLHSHVDPFAVHTVGTCLCFAVRLSLRRRYGRLTTMVRRRRRRAAKTLGWDHGSTGKPAVEQAGERTHPPPRTKSAHAEHVLHQAMQLSLRQR